MRDENRPTISVLIPTYNRAGLLIASLESLERQTLPRDRFEVLVVDDGSTDDTPEVCRGFHHRLPLRYFRLDHAGISAAKNLGVFTAQAPIVLFFDDDDVAHGELLTEHVAAHHRHPAEPDAVLGYTTWAPWLHITELMRYLTDVGQLLFSYPSIPAGRVLDFRYFWGGRSSCKRSFLARHGVFRQDFESIIEDIELGYRLSRFQLRVFYEPRAISFMNRGITLDEFCRRAERQGRAQLAFSRLHREAVVQDYCQIADADVHWRSMQPQLPQAVAQARRIETAFDQGADDGELREELWQLYKFIFTACRLKGVVEKATENGERDSLSAAPLRQWTAPAEV
jgi:glycosyltransferase involved in cell wall biosynthesis